MNSHLVLLALVYNAGSCLVEIIYMMLMILISSITVSHFISAQCLFLYHFPDIIIGLANLDIICFFHVKYDQNLVHFFSIPVTLWMMHLEQ